MKPRVWKQVLLTVPEQYQELLIGPLTALGFQGFLQETGQLACYMARHTWTKKVEESTRNTLSRFRKEFPHIEARFLQRTVREQNWNAAWERSIGIVDATNHIIVKPTWKKLRAKDKGKIVLQIDPKMSFGTGHHETTRLSLTLLERYCAAGASVLDVGTGTGILAIASVKLGARKAVALDNDEWSIANAKENVRNNRATKQVSILKTDLRKIPKTKFDLVVANIDYPTISAFLPKLIAPLRLGGIIILSGLLTRDVDALLDRLKHLSVIPLEIISENEWVALALVKPHAR
ncbi:MAG TPA: 50S ribosomal protein L11 methyltransferase [Bacteroidota bacterium]